MAMKLAAMIPCYNEESTIEKVISELRKLVPDAVIYVFDNNSSDRTSQMAEKCGVMVLKEQRRGKGFVVQSMFRKVDADIFLIVDGDDTYALSKINEMISLVISGEADMVVGNRLDKYTVKSFRPLHTFGNKLVRNLVNRFFSAGLKDIMSGLRVMNRDFVKNINIIASGFEVETEMTIKALKYNFSIKEVDIEYRERPEGSVSKLNTFSDGILVLKTIFMIFRNYKPLVFFSFISLVMAVISFSTGWIVVHEFIETRYITHVPLAIFASGSMILAIIFFITGIILDSLMDRFDELYNFVRNKQP
jgi:glycosyltransferase involved in cell wall biosynthesis